MIANKRDELSGFGQRLFDLMNEAGYPVARSFAIILLNQGLVTVNPRSKDPVKSRECAVNCVERKIITHLNSSNSNCLQGEFANAYCRFFRCSLDYLYGYTDVKTPNIELQTIYRHLGLSEKAAYNLINGNNYRNGYPINAVISGILENDKFINDWAELNSQIQNTAKLNLELQRHQELYSKNNSGPMVNIYMNSIDQLNRQKSTAERILRGFINDFAWLVSNQITGLVRGGISRAENEIRNAETSNSVVN